MTASVPVPKILECYRLIAKGSAHAGRVVNDYELDFYVDGKRTMSVDGDSFPITRGTLVFRRPGQTVESTGDYNCYIMTLDVSGTVGIAPDQYLRTHHEGYQKTTAHILLDHFPTHIVPKHYRDILDLYEKINVSTYPFPENEQAAKKHLAELLFLISADVVSESPFPPVRTFSEDYVDRACDYINRNYTNPVSVDDLAQYVCVNQNYLIRLFREKNSTTPNRYLNEVRLFHARQMLLQSSLSVTEIALKCGFNHPAYFAECFKKKYSLTPSAFRKQS